MRPHAEARIARLSETEAVSFGPLAHYNKLTGDDGLPFFTGVQTCKPGYRTPLHWHPYVECLFIIGPDGSLAGRPGGPPGPS